MVKESKGVVLGQDRKCSVDVIPLRELEYNDLLIKVHSSAINPSDKGFAKGMYPAGKDLPCFVGFEGSGVVVQTGAAPEAAALKDQKVFFMAGSPKDLGTWAEYTIISRFSVFPKPENLSMEEAACSLVNPLTVQAFIVACQDKNIKAIVHTAAASSLGRMLVKACKKYGINLINIVRRKEQVEILKQIGAEHVLDSSKESYSEELKKKIEELQPMAFYDACGGQTGSTIIAQLPAGSTTYLYGGLEKDPRYTLGPADLIFKQKIITGFWLNTDMKDPQRAQKIFIGTLENLSTGLFTSIIAKAFPFEQYVEAIEYNDKNQTEGKVVLQNPNFNS